MGEIAGVARSTSASISFINVGIRPAGQRGLLRLAHLRRRHHLHGLGDLRRVLDRLDAPADVACAGHERILAGKSA